MQGGATTQFAAIPLNLLNIPMEGVDTPTANYIVSGVWSQKAAEEASKYLAVNVIASNKHTKHTTLPERTATADAVARPLYTYVCVNETVHGVEMDDAFARALAGDGLLVASYDVIYAGAQKNVGPAGVTIVIVRSALLQPQFASAQCPVMLNWSVAAKNDSMYNTPPCQAIYMCGLVFQWILLAGGVQGASSHTITHISSCTYSTPSCISLCLSRSLISFVLSHSSQSWSASTSPRRACSTPRWAAARSSRAPWPRRRARA